MTSCSTRSMKNAKFLQSNRIEFFPEYEPLEGFGSLLPPDVLATLERASAMNRISGKLLEVLRVNSPPTPRTTASSPLFSGELRFVEAVFSAGDAPLQVLPQDLATAMSYSRLCVGPLSAYASQYGPNSLSVSPTTVPLKASVPGGRYNDQMLAGWVDGLARQFGLGPDSCLVVLNPTGVVNTDADPGKGVLGYHFQSPSGVPYAFVNLMGSSLTVADASDSFALALSHEIVEMAVDPRADGSNPETSDSCSGNCSVDNRNYFSSAGAWIGPSPVPGYGFFTCGVAKPSEVNKCPALPSACSYPPPSAGAWVR